MLQKFSPKESVIDMNEHNTPCISGSNLHPTMSEKWKFTLGHFLREHVYIVNINDDISIANIREKAENFAWETKHHTGTTYVENISWPSSRPQEEEITFIFYYMMTHFRLKPSSYGQHPLTVQLLENHVILFQTFYFTFFIRWYVVIIHCMRVVYKQIK